MPGDASRSIKLELRHLECIQLRVQYRYEQETMPSLLVMIEFSNNILYPAIDAFSQKLV